jgi:lysophospholipase L1-like esterase
MKTHQIFLHRWTTGNCAAYADRPSPKINVACRDLTMKRHQFCRLAVVCSLIVFTCALMSVGAQEPAQAKKGPERYEKEIQKLEEKFQSQAVPPGGVLFVGSSSIRLWKLDQSFPDLKAVNHGFGGSTLADSIHFFDRIIAPVKPSTIVMYAGDNDLAGGMSPEEVSEDFRKLAERILKELPECHRTVFIAVKPSIKRWDNRVKIQQANALIQKQCDENPKLEFLNIWPLMLNDQGEPRKELLVIDGLHMSDEGYRIWADALKPLLPDAKSTDSPR